MCTEECLRNKVLYKGVDILRAKENTKQTHRARDTEGSEAVKVIKENDRGL